jgi:protein SCO1/2
MNKKRILRTVLIIVAALGFSAAIAWFQVNGDQASPQRAVTVLSDKPKGTATQNSVAGMSVGGPFTLTDHRGQNFTEANLRGQHSLIYFGFTFCPAICPTELQKMTAALKQAGPLADKILPVFITVDPDRDTQENMAAYVAQFDDSMVGLTGTQAQIDTVLKAYHIYARKVQDPAMTEYTMDHSSYIYFMDPAGGLIGIYGVNSTPAEIAAAIRDAIPNP